MFQKLLSKISPMALTMLVASLVIICFGVIRVYQKETLEANVTYTNDNPSSKQDKKSGPRSISQSSLGMNDVSVRYADRLRDATSLTLALGLHVLNARFRPDKPEVYQTVEAVMQTFSSSELMPPQQRILFPQNKVDYGMVFTPRGLLLVRYRPKPLTIEVLAVGSNGLKDGAIFLVRLPESKPVPRADGEEAQQAGGFATLFVAPMNDATIPLPFSSTEAFLAAKWTQEPLRSAPVSGQQIMQMQTWFNEYNKRSGEGN